jgi:hypothetical protein
MKVYVVQSKRLGQYWCAAQKTWVVNIELATHFTKPPTAMRNEMVVTREGVFA